MNPFLQNRQGQPISRYFIKQPLWSPTSSIIIHPARVPCFKTQSNNRTGSDHPFIHHHHRHLARGLKNREINNTTYSAAIVEKGQGQAQGQISLRPFHLSDIDDFMVWSSDESVARFCRWDAFAYKEAALVRLRERIIPHPWYRAICLDGRPIGAISVTSEGSCRASLGYVLASEHWGKGIAKQAVKMAAAAVFAEEWRPEVERLEAVADVENPASGRVLEKAGFVKEAVLRKYFVLKGKTRDVVMYSLISTDFKAIEMKMND